MKTRIYDRNKLYKEVWEEPMTTLSKRYGVSDVALKKQCVKMNIPLPKAGHWMKVRAEHKIEIPPLPKYDGPNVVELRINPNDAISRKMEDVLLFMPEEKRAEVKEYCLSLTVPCKLTKPHELIKETKLYYRLRKESGPIRMDRFINMKVSDEQMERAYRIYNSLFKALEHLGYTIEIKESKYRQYRNRNELFVCLNEDSIPIFIREKQKQIKRERNNERLLVGYNYGNSIEYKMTGKLHFGIDSYHAKRKNWNDTSTKKIEDQIGEIMLWIMEAIQEEKVRRERFEIAERRRLEEQRIQQDIEERKELELKRVELLKENAKDWEEAERIRKFADAVELKIVDIDKEADRDKALKWLKWARQKADWIDPLVNKQDDLLGNNVNSYSSFK